MPPIHLSDAQLSALAAFLLTLTPGNATDLESVPDKVVEGAMIYQQQQCGMCHIVNGVGVQLGPGLIGCGGPANQGVDRSPDPQPQAPFARDYDAGTSARVTWMG